MRYITLTDELKQSAIADFTEKLNNNRFSDSKITFSFDLNSKVDLKDKIIVNVTPEAWLKMWALVQTESKEIGWHGLVNRVNDRCFIITDIMMYPQVTSSVTVETDDVAYGNWLHQNISDEDFEHLRLHGHSHVNMSTRPSGVDTTWYNQILQGLEQNDFYIFMILNKREDYFIEIYDLATNTIYEKDDIKLNVIMNDGNYLDNWTTKQKEQYIKVPEKPTQFSGYSRLPSVDNIKKFDNEDTDMDFKDLLMEITLEDLADTQLVNGMIEELNKTVVYTGYYGVGWQKWSMLDKEDKIITAQEYYLSKKAPNLSASKRKRGRPRKNYLGGLYD